MELETIKYLFERATGEAVITDRDIFYCPFALLYKTRIGDKERIISLLHDIIKYLDTTNNKHLELYKSFLNNIDEEFDRLNF